MTEPIRYQLANAHDAAALLALQRLAYQAEAQRYQDWSIPPLTQTLDELRVELTTHTVLKAEQAGQLIGAVRAIVQHGICDIGRLMVHPAYQRRGIGTRLLQDIEACFPNAERFRLFTGSLSVNNLQRYQRHGYRITHTQELTPQVQLVWLEKHPLAQ